MYGGPRKEKEKNMCGATWMVPMGLRPSVVRAHIHELALTGIGPYLLLSVPGVARY